MIKNNNNKNRRQHGHTVHNSQREWGVGVYNRPSSSFLLQGVPAGSSNHAYTQLYTVFSGFLVEGRRDSWLSGFTAVGEAGTAVPTLEMSYVSINLLVFSDLHCSQMWNLLQYFGFPLSFFCLGWKKKHKSCCNASKERSCWPWVFVTYALWQKAWGR